MTALVLAVLGASVVGSLHCAGMCGGFVAFAAGDGAVPGRRGSLGVQLAYNGGRLVAYAALGALAGAVGGALDLAGSLVGVQRIAGAVAGAAIVLWGCAALARALGAPARSVAAPRVLGRLLARGLAAVALRSPAVRATAIGLLAGCLPCGWLYAFVVTAAGTGSAAGGALVMTAFWLGTVPLMLSLGAGLAVLAAPLRRRLPVACAIAMIVVGLLAVAGRVRVVGAPLHRPAATHAVPLHDR